MAETWRTGRHSGHNIYVQTGEEPSDSDRQIGAMFDLDHARIAVEAVNAATPGLDPERIDRALRHVIALLDYDLHKALECGEEDGEDTYHEEVARFIAAYEEAPDA